jgi:signal transduction histidine kinase
MISHLIDRYIQDDEKKLAFKISIASFFILICILTAIIWASYTYEYRSINHELETESNMIDMNPGIREIIKNENLPFRWIKEWEKRRWPRDVIVFDKEKNIIKNDFLFIDDDIIEELFLLKERRNYTLEINEHTYLIARKNIDDNTIFFFRDLTPLRSFHLSLIIIALIGSTIWLIVIFLLARYLARITIEPIREQSKELEAYSHNVAHELRTPLSIMRSNLELLRIKPEPRFINSTDEEISGMERIIESLLFLAKPGESNEKTELNITKKTEEIVEKYKNEAPIHYSHEKKHIFKKTNEELYNRILCNLIENAIKYKSEWEIKIGLTKNAIVISNSIENDLSEIEQKNLTKVFYQWDTSRSSTGYGLGLALVSKIVEILGWKMSIETKNKEFTITIIF